MLSIDEIKRKILIYSEEVCGNTMIDTYSAQKYVERAYNKAIDDFAEKLKRENKETIPTHSGFCRMSFDEVVDEIAEQLKKGER